MRGKNMSEYAEEYQMFEPFEIDNGELDGLDNQMCFCLGAEYVQWLERFRSNQDKWDVYVIKENAERVANMGRRFNYEVVLETYDDEWTLMKARRKE